MNTRTSLVLLEMLLFAKNAFGLATESIGPDPKTVDQPGWPKGIVNLARHPSRVYTRWVNGGESFYYKTDRAGMNELLRTFSECRMRDYEVRLCPGTERVSSFDKREFDYNVSLKVTSGISLFAMRGRDATATHDPVLTLYVGEGLSMLKSLELPKNLLVQCGVPGADVTTGTRPLRQVWHGCLQRSEGRPAADLEHGISTRVALWSKDSPDGIEVATVDREGFFSIPFSDTEWAALENGETWLTAKMGNYLAAPMKQGPIIPPDSLSQEKEKAKPVLISEPRYYYGRLLFEDGSPAILNPPPWPGAEIWADFPYAGSGKLDAEGYFRVALEPEQFEALKARKSAKNIYFPTKNQGESRAQETFPPEILSSDKETAGVVKLPKPQL